MAATHEKFFLCLFLKSKVNQSTTESAYTFLGQVIQAILSLVFLDKIQSQPVNQEKRTHHILRQWINQCVERHHCLKFFPIITKSTIPPTKWRKHSLIFGQISQVNHFQINHSCDPNYGRVWIDGTKQVVAFATRPIAKGEEISDAYSGIFSYADANERSG